MQAVTLSEREREETAIAVAAATTTTDGGNNHNTVLAASTNAYTVSCVEKYPRRPSFRRLISLDTMVHSHYSDVAAIPTEPRVATLRVSQHRICTPRTLRVFASIPLSPPSKGKTTTAFAVTAETFPLSPLPRSPPRGNGICGGNWQFSELSHYYSINDTLCGCVRKRSNCCAVHFLTRYSPPSKLKQQQGSKSHKLLSQNLFPIAAFDAFPYSGPNIS